MNNEPAGQALDCHEGATFNSHPNNNPGRRYNTENSPEERHKLAMPGAP
ncbi:hypothetical protein [Shewanella insulae]|nr:hypothetical protein [Shewanella insulae]